MLLCFRVRPDPRGGKAEVTSLPFGFLGNCFISFTSVSSPARASHRGWVRHGEGAGLPRALSHTLGVLVCFAHGLKTKPAGGPGRHLPRAWCAGAAWGAWAVAHCGEQSPSASPWLPRPRCGTGVAADTFALPCATFTPCSAKRDGGQQGLRSGQGAQALPVPGRGQRAHKCGQGSQQSRPEVRAQRCPQPPGSPRLHTGPCALPHRHLPAGRHHGAAPPPFGSARSLTEGCSRGSPATSCHGKGHQGDVKMR